MRERVREMDKPDREVSLDCRETIPYKTRRPMSLPISLIAVLMIMFTACRGTATSNSTLVHLGPTTFMPPLITVKKGERILFVNDGTALHIIGNGIWEQGGGTSTFYERSYKEPGAPKVNVQVSGGSSQTIGPFHAAGTFHLYCLVHPGMNLTVIVS
jgi:plastocyanin